MECDRPQACFPDKKHPGKKLMCLVMARAALSQPYGELKITLNPSFRRRCHLESKENRNISFV
jgi:hypothetical protein